MPEQQDGAQAPRDNYGGNSNDRRRAKRLEERVARNAAARILGQLEQAHWPPKGPSIANGENNWAGPGFEFSVGVLLHAVGLGDVLPFWLSTCLYLVSGVLMCHSAWSLTRKRTWRWFIRAGVLCAWAVLARYGTYRQYEREMVAIQFKDNPALTWFRKQIIWHDFSRAKIFLADLGVPTPGELPPIAVNEKQSAVSPSVPVYRGELQIKPGDLANRQVATDEHMSYVMSVNTGPLSNVTGVNFLLAGMYQLSAWTALAEYFNSAYWDQNLTSWPWAKRLWAIRVATGTKKTDRIIAYTTKLIKDSPGGGLLRG